MTGVADKPRMRREALERRLALAAGNDIGQALVKAAGVDVWPGRGPVGGYFPVRGEANVLPLLEALSRERQVALPTVGERDGPLVFRSWAPGDETEDDSFGIPCPLLTRPAVVPEILLVPLVGFDRRGHRLGYGGGHYDRTLEHLRENGSVWAVGVAYAAQEIDNLPEEPHDQRLDAVLTEDGLTAF